MATRRQRKAVDKMVENGGMVIQAMKDAEYSPNTYHTPSKLTQSKGFKEICEENGLTHNLITKSLVEDIEKKPQKRLGELGLGAEILGMRKQDSPDGGVKVNVLIVDKGLADKYGITPRTIPDSN